MRLIFMGSGDFAVPALEALVAAGHEIVATYSQPPRQAGRGKRLQPTPLAKRAHELGLDVRCPGIMDGPEFANELTGIGAEFGILVAFGTLLPDTVLSAPVGGFLNIHPSLLPRWRGAAPIQRTIMAGDSATGVCVMQMNERFDDGPVLLRREVPVPGDATYSTLAPVLAVTGAELVVEALANIDRLEPVPQGTAGRTSAPRIDKSETRIDWNRPAAEICRQVRALSRVPGAWTEHGRMRLKVLAAEVVEGSGKPGEVLDSELTVACGENAVRLVEIQRPGKRSAAVAEFLRGCQIEVGATLGCPESGEG